LLPFCPFILLRSTIPFYTRWHGSLLPVQWESFVAELEFSPRRIPLLCMGPSAEAQRLSEEPETFIETRTKEICEFSLTDKTNFPFVARDLCALNA